LWLAGVLPRIVGHQDGTSAEKGAGGMGGGRFGILVLGLPTPEELLLVELDKERLLDEKVSSYAHLFLHSLWKIIL